MKYTYVSHETSNAGAKHEMPLAWYDITVRNTSGDEFKISHGFWDMSILEMSKEDAASYIKEWLRRVDVI